LSIDIELLEHESDTRIKIALMIMNEIAPKLLNDGVYIGERLSTAYTWNKFLCRVSKCGVEDKDYKMWGLDDIRMVADGLIEYALGIIQKLVS